MMTDRNSEFIGDDPISDGITDPIPRMPSPSRPTRDVTFRRRGPRRPSSKQPLRLPPRLALIALAVLALAIVVAGIAWGAVALRHGGAASSSAKVGASSAKHVAKSTPSSTATTAQDSSAAGSSTPAPKPKLKAKPKPKPKAKPVATASSVTFSPVKHTSAGAAAKPAAVASAPSGQVVVIDAGHQGKGDSSLEPIGPGSSQKKPKVASGASGYYAPHDESEINLEVALKLRTALEARGIKVIMVRTKQNVNISNSQRAAIANKAHVALFIRLHCDGISDSSVHGFSTLIPAKNKWTGSILSASAKAGRIVQAASVKATGAANRGVVNRGDLSGFNWSKVPTILVEMGFMSNRAEDKALTTSAYQHKLATGLANGVVSYLKTR